MGDRTYLSIELHGHVETVGMLNAILKTLETEGLVPSDDAGEPLLYIKESILTGFDPVFHDHECNYATIDDAEAELQTLSFPYRISWEAGGSFGAGVKSYWPGMGVYTQYGSEDGPVIPITTLEKAVKANDPVAAIKEIIDEANRADGDGLPSFTVSDEVRAYLGLSTANNGTTANQALYIHAGEGI